MKNDMIMDIEIKYIYYQSLVVDWMMVDRANSSTYLIYVVREQNIAHIMCLFSSLSNSTHFFFSTKSYARISTEWL